MFGRKPSNPLAVTPTQWRRPEAEMQKHLDELSKDGGIVVLNRHAEIVTKVIWESTGGQR